MLTYKNIVGECQIKLLDLGDIQAAVINNVTLYRKTQEFAVNAAALQRAKFNKATHVVLITKDNETYMAPVNVIEKAPIKNLHNTTLSHYLSLPRWEKLGKLVSSHRY